MEIKDCLICERISMIEEGIEPHFVAELETGYVVIGDYQYFKGYSLFLCKQHKTELHFLDEDFKIKFLTEMSKVSEAVYNAFKPDKLNYEMLGNDDSHMHWHIFPRRENDAPVKGPVHRVDKKLLYAKEALPTEEELIEMKIKLYNELEKLTPILRKGKF